MNTHARSTPAARPTTSWILVAAIIAGALVLGGAVIAGSITLLVIGAVVVLAALGCAAVLTHRGAAPFSFTEEFPEHTFGPRATEHGDSSPPIDTEPHRPPGPAHYHIVEEFDAEAMSDPPDDQRVFPQYVNLDPDERLRNVAGREVIERAEPYGEPGDTEPGDADDGRHPADRQ